MHTIRHKIHVNGLVIVDIINSEAAVSVSTIHQHVESDNTRLGIVVILVTHVQPMPTTHEKIHVNGLVTVGTTEMEIFVSKIIKTVVLDNTSLETCVLVVPTSHHTHTIQPLDHVNGPVKVGIIEMETPVHLRLIKTVVSDNIW